MSDNNGDKKIPPEKGGKKRSTFWGAWKSQNKDYRNFFLIMNWITLGFAILGLIGSILIFLSSGNIFKAVAVFFLVSWIVAFLRYFFWSVYHYNINYGLTERDWDNIDKAKKRLLEGEEVLESEINEPENNPFRSQTFGLPPGTVRGMIAFSLLFGALTLLIASMGMTTIDYENSLIRDQFEFFKTAFLMMIAFYFGDKSLKFLQRRWQTPGSNVGKEPQGNEEPANPAAANVPNEISELKQDDIDYQVQNGEFDDGVKKTETKKTSNTVIKEALSLALDSKETKDLTANITKPAKLRIPIIDAGHGGLNSEGEYTTPLSKGKRYKFTGENQKDIGEIFEGVINREIAKKLIKKLDEANMRYVDLNSTDHEDLPLKKRVEAANALFEEDKSYYFLSIHSNSASSSLSGTGSDAHGFEIFTSIGTTTSDLIAKIAAEAYKKHFKDKFKFRGIKERNFTVLKDTKCPAILVENLFFDNFEEAKYLKSQSGQQEIADCLFEALQKIS